MEIKVLNTPIIIEDRIDNFEISLLSKLNFNYYIQIMYATTPQKPPILDWVGIRYIVT